MLCEYDSCTVCCANMTHGWFLNILDLCAVPVKPSMYKLNMYFVQVVHVHVHCTSCTWQVKPTATTCTIFVVCKMFT